MTSLRIVSAIGRAWVALYTAGLPAEARDRRRREVDSDLFEQALAASEFGGPMAVPVAARFVRGAPSDVMWRLGYDGGAPDEITSTWTGRFAVVLVLAIAATSLVYAVLHTFGYFGAENRGYALINVALMGASLLLLRGLAMMRESPRKGAAIVLVVGLGMAFMWAWMPPIALAVLAVVVYGVVRAWRFARQHNDTSAHDRVDSS